ncbi:formate dehydrogenase accessory sulfurtransferase FdhD [Alteromonas sp. ALT199]|uniref:formate dehydrogenase accessory sulfurtransferase FdhD n=1 Tax=unclassified Alteromonas TaxID=2614992 RepID=UPI0004466CA9|nr:formate dehydrogenase accessory sulfurtransferase FdhD [Alteromonas sp. ALT199]MBT3137174.1 formate dehydrogenase accessory sulfurtransferase FdhD [Alteromonas sp. ALT199]
MKNNAGQQALILDTTPYIQRYPLAEEVALSISYNGINYAVMLITPHDIEDFIVGFSLSSDIIEHPRQLYNIELARHSEHINAEVEIANQAFWKLKENKRQLAGASGCGLCGIEALDNALPQLQVVETSPLPNANWFEGLRELISNAQVLAQKSGAVHGALYVDAKRNVLACKEDIGRHNAFDKLIGAIATNKLYQSECIVVLTSRCSLELVQKAIRSKLPVVVTLSAPTALSVKWASRYGVTLIHVPKYDAPRVYSPHV